MFKYILLLVVMTSSCLFAADANLDALKSGEDAFRASAKKLAQQRLEKNRTLGAAFLKKNKTKKKVVTLPSGLQYIVITEGTGQRPKITDRVETHYAGRLINGKLFDSSYYRGKPITFPVKGVIKGWTEALLLMNEGAKWKLFIPSDLAYGSRGAGDKIAPGSTLVFDIELLSIK